MSKIQLSLVILGGLLLFNSCSSPKVESFGDELVEQFGQKNYSKFDTTAYFTVFKSEQKRLATELNNPKWMAEFADSSKGLTFIGRNLSQGKIDTLYSFLTAIGEHGLSAEPFHAEEIRGLYKDISTSKTGRVEDLYPLLARLDLLGADGYVTYVNALQHGAVNPKRLYGRYFEKQNRMTISYARKVLDSIDMCELLPSIQPTHSYYLKLQKILVSKGLSSQAREDIYLLMEKLRWMNTDFPEKYVFVNIPEQKLKMVANSKVEDVMNICVGETTYAPFAKRGEGGSNHETPVMSGQLDRMQVNPVWNIPSSIVKKELIASLRANPYYLESRNMVAYNKRGQLVDPSTVNWSADSVLNFRFKQNPGTDNSLGSIKFIFSNPYAIYLHDTPAKHMFSAKNRAVSHGCVRVEKPAALASFLIDDEEIAAQIASEIVDTLNVSRWVKMKKHIPVYITYYTTWLNDEGELYKAPDIYGYDERLRKAMKKYLPKTI
ncbi:L,D-transpeptidase family protein [Sphingobacterium sp. SYP-B4668]|uniref:L,D-transpeptidase family protein n=1 Tax=Sphingobacterium sp. SYP-B4668 TaxID=2996035 RepID=UPI0022DE07AF|nr:L,D-transpeptidase family protein [Sphingobacterium sp. SYP-B4668]